MEMQFKIYVEVIARHDTEGKIHPLVIVWEDGTNYEIDRITDVQRMASRKAGGIGLRYSVMIQGEERFLFHEIGEGDKWFVENKMIYDPETDPPYYNEYD